MGHPGDRGTAAVTGAGSGIGLETARVLASAGYTVVMAARSRAAVARAADELSAAGCRALAVPTDVSDEQQVAALMQQAVAATGRLDVLVNAAAEAAFGPVHELAATDWRRTLAATLTGTFLCCKHALRHMLPQGSGQIVNILSIAAREVFPNSAAYCAAKWGALGLTRVIAAEARAMGIRVTALLPGATATPFWDQYESHPNLSDMMDPRHVAETVLFLLNQPPDVVTDEMVLMPRKGIL